MDPNVTLANLRLTAGLIQQALDAGNAPDVGQVQELLDDVETLDVWLCKGGFRPAEWVIRHG